MTHNPTKKQVQVVIDTLKKSLAITGPGLDMGIAGIYGTLLCHGGHYAVGKDLDPRKFNYQDGADLMAQDLGFQSRFGLTSYASANKQWWGGEWGREMFSNEIAFVSETRPEGAKSLVDIILHWEEVKERTPQSLSGRIFKLFKK